MSTLLSGLTDTVFVGYFGFKMALETDNHKNIKWKSDFFIDRKWKAACFCKCCHVTEAGKNRLTTGSCHGKHGAFPWRYISLLFAWSYSLGESCIYVCACVYVCVHAHMCYLHPCIFFSSKASVLPLAHSSGRELSSDVGGPLPATGS